MANDTDFLTPPEIARLCDASSATVRRWIDQGALPSIRSVGNHRKVARADVETFLRSQMGLRQPKSAARVLVIDDDQNFGRSLKRALEAVLPVTVDVANSSAQGLLLAGLHRPTAILLDASMPYFDGFEACRAIRSLPPLANIHLFGISGDPAAEVRFREAGVDAFLLKPFTVAIVCEMIRMSGVGATARRQS